MVGLSHFAVISRLLTGERALPKERLRDDRRQEKTKTHKNGRNLRIDVVKLRRNLIDIAGNLKL